MWTALNCLSGCKQEKIGGEIITDSTEIARAVEAHLENIFFQLNPLRDKDLQLDQTVVLAEAAHRMKIDNYRREEELVDDRQ